MKRTLLLNLILLLLIANVSFAQTERMPFGAESSYKLTKHIELNTPKSTAKDIIFSEDFEDDTDGFNTDRWQIMRSTDTTATDLAPASAPMWFVCTPSNFNGNGSNYIYSGQKSAAIAYTASQATWLITKEPFAIAQNYTLNFWLYFLHNEAQEINTQFYVMALIEGETTWKSIGKWEKDEHTNQFANIVSIEFPNDYVDKNIQIAFVYVNNENSGFQVAFDDVQVGNLTEPNISIKADNYLYSSVPLALLNTIDYGLKAYVKNSGAPYNKEGATANVTIIELESFESTKEIDFELGTGEDSYIRFPDTPSFTETGDYKISYSITQDYTSNEGGKSYAKTENEFTFAVTDKLFSTDYCNTNIDIAGGFTAGIGVPFGNKYPVGNDIVVAGIEMLWPASTGEQTFIGQIYEINPLNNSLDLLFEKEFTKASNTNDTTTQHKFTPIYLTGGADFFVAVKQISSTPLNVAFDQVSNGQFWRIRNNKLELLTNPMFGNIAVRMLLDEPTETPTLSFNVTDGTQPLENVTIDITNQESITTDSEGKASIELENGSYTYTISLDDFAQVTDEIVMNYTNREIQVTMLPEYQVTFNVTELVEDQQQPLGSAEILINNTLAITNSEGKAIVKLPQGTHSYNVLLDGYTPYSDLLELTSDSTINISLQEGATYSVDFSITARHNEESVENVKVELEGYGTKYTNNNGTTQFTGVLPAENGLNYTITKDGYEAKTGTTEPIVDQLITVNDTIDIITYYVRVEVSDENSLIEGARVIIHGEELLTDQGGVVIFPSVVPGNNIVLRIIKEGYITLEEEISLYNNNLRLSYLIEKEPSSVNISDENKFSIYPNPNNGIFTITGSETYDISVVDISGRLVYSQPKNGNKTIVDISHLQQGIYIVQLLRDNEVYSYRIVKH